MISLSYKRTLVSKWAGVFLFAILICLDQFVKLRAGQIFQNHAFAFSLPVPNSISFVVYAVVLASMVYYCLKNYRYFSKVQAAAWVFIFAGALSNVVERIVLGYVRDFIYITAYRWTGVYNLADFYIILGILLLLIPSMLSKHKTTL